MCFPLTTGGIRSPAHAGIRRSPSKALYTLEMRASQCGDLPVMQWLSERWAIAPRCRGDLIPTDVMGTIAKRRASGSGRERR